MSENFFLNAKMISPKFDLKEKRFRIINKSKMKLRFTFHYEECFIEYK